MAQASKDDIEFEFAFICDDVRVEATRKLIFIGVYPNSIGVDDFPAKIQLHLVLAFRTTQSGNMTVTARASLDGDAISETEGVVSVKGDGRAIFGIPFLLHLKQPGKVSFEVDIDGRQFGEVLVSEAITAMAL